jgi:hypothetical protein
MSLTGPHGIEKVIQFADPNTVQVHHNGNDGHNEVSLPNQFIFKFDNLWSRCDQANANATRAEGANVTLE